MLCKSPYVKQGIPLGCGQCMHCRINRNRLWANRILLESYCHAESSFLTCTYADSELPSGGTLRKEDVQKFLKRLRKRVSPLRVRYYGVGEYGEETGRPHYHFALFGLGMRFESLFRDVWGHGNVHVGELTLHSARYISSYIQKGWNGDAYSQAYLKGRAPEFSVMSLNPGIGAVAVDDLAAAYTSKYGSLAICRAGDVPDTIGSGRQQMPLGRYLKEKIREKVGLEGGWQEGRKRQFTEEMQVMLNAYGKHAFYAAKPFVDWAKINKREANARAFTKVKKL